jgi:hypothetical protein
MVDSKSVLAIVEELARLKADAETAETAAQIDRIVRDLQRLVAGDGEQEKGRSDGHANEQH